MTTTNTQQQQDAQHSTHTPGPWDTGTMERGRFCVYAPQSNGRGICVMSNTQKSWGDDMVAKFGDHPMNLEADANARLIAAAPELLDVARAAVEWAADAPAPYRDWPFVAAARAAIAKATATP